MNPDRQQVSSGAPWEAVAGYSRAVRIGSLVAVSGTVGRNADGSVPEGPYAQAKQAIAIVAAALEEVGCGLDDVIRTRMFVTDISHFDEIARAHAEAFGTVRPATSMVEVRRLVDDAYLLEIEVDALAG